MKPTRMGLAATLFAAMLALPAMAQSTSQSPSSKTMPPSAGSPAAKPGGSAATSPGTSGTTTPGTAAPSGATQGRLVDINTASKEELDSLPGIGGPRAEAIIKNRPYKGKDDLLSKKVIPRNVYEGIKDKVIARQK
jgi:DNA uptake protein ComE-like DNA-binding protein